MAKISILIPVYNTEKYIGQCLESLLSNTIIDKCEIIICNDCTQDNSMEVAQSVLSKRPDISVKILNHSENKKIALTRQELLEAATGKYIQFVDSDDWVEPDYLEKLYTLAEETQADITSCNIIKEYANTKIILKQILSDKQNQNISELLTSKTVGYLHSKLIRRAFIVENNLSFDPDLIYGEDTLFFLKCFFHTSKTANTNLPLYHYRIFFSHTQFTESYANERIKGVQKIESFIQSIDSYEQFIAEVSYRKIFVLLQILPYAPFPKRKKYYSVFSDISNHLKVSGAKGLFYKYFSKSIDNKNFFMYSLFIIIAKIRTLYVDSKKKRM